MRTRNTMNRKRRGASMIGFGLTIALIGIVALGSVDSFGRQISGLAQKASNELSQVNSGGSKSESPSSGATASSGDCPGTKVVITYTGAVETLSVPAGCNGMTVKLWGAAGGSNDWTGDSHNNYGGSGSFVTADVSVAAGSQLRFVVGEGGKPLSRSQTFGGGGAGGRLDGIGSGENGSSGGGYTGIFDATVSQASALVVAGAGGGSSGSWGGHGGGGGSPDGQNGTAYPNDNPGYGRGATTTGPGAGGTGGRSDPGQSGSAFVGGDASQGTSGAGGGGGGYYGGGGGAGYYTGGGGGSSYADPSRAANANFLGGSTGSGATTAPGSGDPDYVAGVGAAVYDASGGDGLIVIQWTGADPTAN